mgnify:CR=1 FL=1
MILFIWVSIQKPHVEIDIIVNNSFILMGREVVDKFVNELVISVIDRRNDFI